MSKTLYNSPNSKTKENVPDVRLYGDECLFQLLNKASSKKENWMKCTKAMEIGTIGCVVQVTTQQDSNVSESLTYIPGVKIVDDVTYGGKKLEAI